MSTDTTTTPTCDYCGKPSKLVAGNAIYPHRPHLHRKSFYVCADCDARVGCHPGTTRPLGRLANTELRRAKSEAHAAFDPLWTWPRSLFHRRRGDAYQWLAGELGIDIDDCHIGMFDVATCRRVVEACNALKAGAKR